ncbi:hypothetical protein [Pseudomonas sp. DP-17]|uniref:hypothetical protein n=1 Tax=Pseudomonas sp. DP-17 TaxID=1580486 RepID=UPI001EFA3C2C|nr:hypothetical protein [Pseudomonas sp. DP-17]MCG8906255.1 hypothetical protein [Pseudomonas sp. DP-17]
MVLGNPKGKTKSRSFYAQIAKGGHHTFKPLIQKPFFYEGKMGVEEVSNPAELWAA